ncbi:MAG: DUF262 domain-containing protein [Bacteroidia bacterium]|nr:DUF262 domain-containing protein [Bacteroidia bacterium]
MSNNPTSEKLTFRELISKHKIEIPIIQRDYAQGRDGKEELRKNFLSALLKAVNGKELELDFVYGTVIDNVLQPLDGQQRLTTLFLLHWFIAIKENKLDDELKKNLTKFTYETRTSSRDFCESLINKGIVYNAEQKISEQIIDSSWFFLSWKRDPTIKSMLTMLDAIQQIFQNETAIWNKLNNIGFHYIELQNFGLSDDLYIKMNARGKPLTDFENFKAKFEQYITAQKWEEGIETVETFAYKIDTDWTNFFWNYRDETKNVFDEQLLNFFRTMAVINYALKKKTIGRDEIFENNVRILRSRDENASLIDLPISFNQYLELECFDEEYFKTLKSVLNKISDKKGLKTFLFDSIYADERKIFSGAIQNNFSYPDLVIAFAYYQYLASEETIEIENLENWLRIVRNLVEGSRPYLFNNANEFANALHSINELLPNRNSIVKYFTETKINSLSGFISEQVVEEKIKAKLITQNEDWEKAIIEIENHKYFNGQIGFLLDWCKDEDQAYNFVKFKGYVEKAKAIFGENGLNHFDKFLFERALLAKGDYLLKKGSNYSFLIDNERDISWKRLLRDNNEKREILKQLVDKVSVLNLTNDLQEIVDGFSDKNDWRYYFIKQFEMISACGSQKLIRFDDNSDFNILLLGSTTTSGYHKEYYSYSLFVDLKINQPNISYYDQRSVNDWKYFELNDKQIAFDCKTGKYIQTQNNDWENRIEFENREKAILEIIGTN